MIPFNQATFTDSEAKLAVDSMLSGHISGNGPFTKAAQQLLSELHGGPDVLLTTSCTHALEMAARLMDLQPGDEVIVPAYTFVSTASAFVWNGARPVFADVRPDTLNIDPLSVADLMTNRTKGICIVHYAGVGATPDEFSRLADAHNVTLIEDNAHGLGAHWKGQPLGTFGALSTLSFHETKNITCGEGGALVVNDPNLLDRAEILREKGTNRSNFLRGQVDKYTWVDSGSSWVMSDVLAAILVAQLQRFQEIQSHRQYLWQNYWDSLASWALATGLSLPGEPFLARQAAHMFYLKATDADMRDALIGHLRKHDIHAVFHYQSLHESPAGSTYHDGKPLPNAQEASRTVVRLPLFGSMTSQQQARVIEVVQGFPV